VDARDLELHYLLVWEAGRAYRDHWFDENRGAYYANAVRTYVSDARNLAGATNLEAAQKEQRLAAVNKAEELARRVEIKVASSHDPIALTSEQVFEFTYDLKVDVAGTDQAKYLIPEGQPVVEVEVERSPGALPLLQLASPVANERKLLTINPEHAAVAIECRVRSPFLEKLRAEAKPFVGGTHPRETRTVLRGVFRGEYLNQPVGVQLHLAADQTIYKYPPPKSGIAVRADPKLIESLTDAHRPGALRFQLTLETGKPVLVDGKDDGVKVSADTSTNLHWYKGLSPGLYKAVVPSLLVQPIKLEPGQLLLASLTKEDNRLAMERVVYAHERSNQGDRKPQVKDKGDEWVLALLSNQRTERGWAEMLLTLED
jgi:hypothetical protein